MCVTNLIILVFTGQFNAPMCGLAEDAPILHPIYWFYQSGVAPIALIVFILAMVVVFVRLPLPMSDALRDDLYASVLRADYKAPCPYCGGNEIQEHYGTCAGCGYKRNERR